MDHGSMDESLLSKDQLLNKREKKKGKHQFKERFISKSFINGFEGKGIDWKQEAHKLIIPI